jgi:glycosyltransferase involved in cell wall biosynthesis
MDASGWTDDALILCFNGAFREKKGAFEIVEAMRRLEEQGSRARLLLVGSIPGGLEEAAIGDCVAGLVERGMCYRTGDIARDEVPSWLAGADVLLLPSLDDGMANALLEGMQAGLCPLVSHVFADVVPEGSEEIVIHHPTGAKIADKIAWLERDRPLVSTLGEAARQRSLHLTPELEAANYLGLFERVAASGRAQPV